MSFEFDSNFDSGINIKVIGVGGGGGGGGGSDDGEVICSLSGSLRMQNSKCKMQNAK